MVLCPVGTRALTLQTYTLFMPALQKVRLSFYLSTYMLCCCWGGCSVARSLGKGRSTPRTSPFLGAGGATWRSTSAPRGGRRWQAWSSRSSMASTRTASPWSNSKTSSSSHRASCCIAAWAWTRGGECKRLPCSRPTRAPTSRAKGRTRQGTKGFYVWLGVCDRHGEVTPLSSWKPRANKKKSTFSKLHQ